MDAFVIWIFTAVNMKYQSKLFYLRLNCVWLV